MISSTVSTPNLTAPRMLLEELADARLVEASDVQDAGKIRVLFSIPRGFKYPTFEVSGPKTYP